MGGIEPPASILQGSRSATDLKQHGAGWLNQTAASAIRGARSVTELNQQREMLFSKAGDRPEMTTRHRADLSMWSASKVQAESGDFWECRTRGSLLSACLGRGWTFADLVETAPGFGLRISKETFHDARHRPRIRLRLQSPCGGGEIDMRYVSHGSFLQLGSRSLRAKVQSVKRKSFNEVLRATTCRRRCARRRSGKV